MKPETKMKWIETAIVLAVCVVLFFIMGAIVPARAEDLAKITVPVPNKVQFCGRQEFVARINVERRKQHLAPEAPDTESRASNAMYQWTAEYAYNAKGAVYLIQAHVRDVCLARIDRLRDDEKHGVEVLSVEGW